MIVATLVPGVNAACLNGRLHRERTQVFRIELHSGFVLAESAAHIGNPEMTSLEPDVGMVLVRMKGDDLGAIMDRKYCAGQQESGGQKGGGKETNGFHSAKKAVSRWKMNARLLPHSDHTVLQKCVPFAAAAQAGIPDAPSRLSARPYASYPSAPVPAGVPKGDGHALPSYADSRWRPVSCTVPVIWCGKGKIRRFR